VIVISGALVLVALVLLVIGLIDPSLGFVYASIAVSLASFGFLVFGILQRRKEVLPATGAPVVEEAVTTLPSSSAAEAVPAITLQKAPAVAADPELQGKVLVVAGRPRYHVDGCRYLSGKEAESVEVADARAEGFTACGVCKPDSALAAAPVTAAAAPVAEPATALEPLDDEPAVAVIPPARATRKPAKAAVVTAPTVALETAEPVAAPAVKATVKKATPVKAPAAPAKPAVTAPVKAAAKAPAKTAAKAAPKPAVKAVAAPAAAKAPAKKAAAPAKKGGVIVIPDRGKYHTAECRYVRGAEGTLELTKAAATKQGYQACGVCNP
jgi:hypothetical protein